LLLTVRFCVGGLGCGVYLQTGIIAGAGSCDGLEHCVGTAPFGIGVVALGGQVWGGPDGAGPADVKSRGFVGSPLPPKEVVEEPAAGGPSCLFGPDWEISNTTVELEKSNVLLLVRVWLPGGGCLGFAFPCATHGRRKAMFDVE
jgi:hypothetical protein